MQQPMPFSATSQSAGTVHLRLMETTDLHVHLAPYDYYADGPNPDLGLVRLAELVDQARAEAKNTLLFDNGDFLQGTPMGDFFAYDLGLREGDLHPVIGAMNALGFDAITLGNHEFNYGLDFLMKAIARADCPVVATNLLNVRAGRATADRSLTRPYALLDRVVHDGLDQPHPIRIGVIGLAPPQVVDWEYHHLRGRIHTRDIVDAAAAWVPEMREAGADLVLALAHTGIGDVRHSDGMENAAVPLSRVPGIDALMLGHSHLLFPAPLQACPPGVDPVAGTINGKPAVMAGFWGSHLGLIDLLLQRDGGGWRVLGSRTDLRPLAHRRSGSATRPAAPAGTTESAHATAHSPVSPRSPQVRRAVQAAHKLTLQSIGKPIGHTTGALHSFFAMLGRSSATAVVADAQRAYVTRHLHGTGFAHLPVVSAVAPFKAGGRGGARNFTHVPAGPLALRHVSDLYAYPNMIVALLLSGAEIRLWLERSAAVFNRILPGHAPATLVDPDAASYNFDILYGVRYAFDLAVPTRFPPRGPEIDAACSRVYALELDGKPLADDAQVILCTNSFRASGAGGFAAASLPERVVHEGSVVTRDVLRQYLGDQANVVPQSLPPLRFKPVPGGRAILSTGPDAQAHLAEIADFAPRSLGLDEDGFLQLQLDFS